MPNPFRTAACLLAVVLAAAPARAGEAEDLARVCAANTAAVEGIRTLHCKVRTVGNPWGIADGEYWRDGVSERFHFTHKGHANKAVSKDGVTKSTVRQDVGAEKYMKSDSEVRDSLEAGRFFWHGAVEARTGAAAFLFTPWADAQCVTHLDGKDVPFAEFARAHRRKVQSVRRSTAGGVPTEAVEFRFDTHTSTAHFDPAAAYMLRKYDGVSATPNGSTSSAEVLAFKQHAPGVFFPERVVIKRRTGGKDEPDQVITFADVQVNQPIPAATFVLRFRQGMPITDRIEKTKYKVNEDGTRIGPATPMPVAVPVPPAPGDDGGPTTETRDEPDRAGWWLLPLSLAVLAAAGGVVLVRRRAER